MTKKICFLKIKKIIEKQTFALISNPLKKL
jgi:hypothetical protein